MNGEMCIAIFYFRPATQSHRADEEDENAPLDSSKVDEDDIPYPQLIMYGGDKFIASHFKQ